MGFIYKGFFPGLEFYFPLQCNLISYITMINYYQIVKKEVPGKYITVHAKRFCQILY